MTSPSPDNILQVTDLSVSYGSILAVKGISLRLVRGEITCLIGANGAGKSTTLMALSRILPLSRGDILYKGTSIAAMEPAEVVRQGIVQVPEGRRVFPRLTVRENLLMGAFLVSDAKLKAERLAEVLDIFPRLHERSSQKAGTLSGGEQQMLALGRALMAGPEVLLLDEPSLGLAPIIIDKIFEVLQDINRRGTTILLVEQNAHLALEISNHAYVLETGAIALGGPSKEVAKNTQVVELYLGG